MGRVSSDDKKTRLFLLNAIAACTQIHEFQPSHEGVSEPMNGASEQSKRSEAERCGASEWSERCERTNVASGGLKTRLSRVEKGSYYI